jgi:hypothetical protein
VALPLPSLHESYATDNGDHQQIFIVRGYRSTCALTKCQSQCFSAKDIQHSIGFSNPLPVLEISIQGVTIPLALPCRINQRQSAILRLLHRRSKHHPVLRLPYLFNPYWHHHHLRDNDTEATVTKPTVASWRAIIVCTSSDSPSAWTSIHAKLKLNDLLNAHCRSGYSLVEAPPSHPSRRLVQISEG